MSNALRSARSSTAPARRRPFVSIRWQILLPPLAIVGVSVAVLLSVTLSLSRSQLVAETTNNLTGRIEGVLHTLEVDRLDKLDKLAGSAAVTRRLFESKPLVIDTEHSLALTATDQVSKATVAIRLPEWHHGDVVLQRDTALVDELQHVLGGSVTIFQRFERGYVRISTNVRRADGQRATGTFFPLDSPVARAIDRGESFRGRAVVVDAWYTTNYDPIRVDGKVVGMLFVGMKDDFGALDAQLGRERIGKSGYPFLMDATGTMLIHPTAKGRNLKNEAFVKAILEHKDGVEELADGDRTQLVAFRHSPDFDLYVGAVIDPDAEVASAASAMSQTLVVVCGGTAAAIALLLLLASRGVTRAFEGVSASLGELADGSFAAVGDKPERRWWRDEASECRGSLRTIRDTLVRFDGCMRDMVKGAAAGDLARRVDSDQFGGAYAQLGDGVNALASDLQRPVQEAIAVLERLAGGDLRARMVGAYVGDHGITKQALNKTVDAFNEVLCDIRQTSGQIAETGDKVESSGAEVSDGATNLAATVEEIGATVKLIAGQIQETADAMAEATRLSQTVGASATDGNALMAQLGDGMRVIEASSSDIVKVIRVIDDIAFQTNLLALNASVEAARAGEHGKGFAVVADEVRNLASRSAKAAKETARLVEESRGKVANGTALAASTAEALQSIVAGIGDVSTRMGEVKGAAAQQADAVRQIDVAMQEIEKVVVKNQRASENASTASETLRVLSETLNGLVGRFMLDTAAAAASARAHRQAQPARGQSRRSERPASQLAH